MFRDIRDPQTIGEAILSAHEASPSESITDIADKWLAPGTAHIHQGESRGQFEARLHAGSKPEHNGQLEMFRAA